MNPSPDPVFSSLLGRLRSLGHELTQGALQLFYPAACHVCGCALSAEQAHFCLACRAAVTADPHPTCPYCAGTVGPHVSLESGCIACRAESFRFERALRLGPYDGVLRNIILRMKHVAHEGLAELIGELWVEHAEARFQELGADVLIPIPLHWQRRLARGYNQSEAIARSLAGRLDRPCRPNWLRRIRNTPRQTTQSAPARRLNVRGAFQARARPELRGKVVLLIDDVLTTGSTCSDAARALLEAGAVRVVVAVLARSQGNDKVTR